MIDNEFNIVLIEQIKRTFAHIPKIQILLIDDNINTGRSAKQAIELFKRYLGEQVDLAYLPLIVRRSRLQILKQFPELLWKRSGFNVEDFDYSAFHKTDEIFLPYKKELLTS